MKKNKHRVFAIVALVVILAFVVVGCGNRNNTTQNSENNTENNSVNSTANNSVADNNLTPENNNGTVKNNGTVNNAGNVTGNYIGTEEAKKLVMAHLGVNDAQFNEHEYELDDGFLD